MAVIIAAWAFASSSGATTYETTLDEEGTLACNCPGFIFKKKRQPRGCKHTRELTPYVVSLLAGTVTSVQVAQHSGIPGILPIVSLMTSPDVLLPHIPEASYPEPSPPPAERKGRLIDFEE